MSTRSRRRVATIVLVAAGIVAGAAASATASTDTTVPAPTDTTSPTDERGGKDGSPANPSSPSAPADAPAREPSAVTEPDGPTSGAITSYQDVQAATIQILATGSFRDPAEGQMSGTGSGSGFVISPDGYAVTNNHVVAGAATLDVFIGGSTEAHNARIVGTSECNDVALIQIAGLSDAPYLEWYDEPLRVGLDVYAAGFPLGDPEFTLTRGIVSKVRANGDVTGTSSIDHTIEHDAAIQHGNSGGPLVSADGRIVGINYAGGITEENQLTAQYYAIASDLAQPVVERLHDGDFESLGINAFAVEGDPGSFGVWVAGVEAGTGASRAGLRPGDVITSMNGVPVGVDLKMSDYCDILRTAGPDGAIALEVVRPDTGEVLRGEVNSDAALTVVDTVGPPDTSTQGTATPDTATPNTQVPVYDGGFTTVTDDTGLLSVDLPNTWAERATAQRTFQDGTQAPAIAAAPVLDQYVNTYDVPGVTLTAFPYTTDIDGMLAASAFTDCTAEPPKEYSDPVFTGKLQWFDNCAGTQTDIIVLVANPSTSSATVQLIFQWTGPADQPLLDQIVGTFNVTR